MDVYRTPDDRFDNLPDFPWTPKYHEWEGLRLAYIDEGDGRPVVLFHGEPSWSFLYRKIIGVLLGKGYRCIAVDQPGFGRSDKPTDIGWYSYDRHTAAAKSVIEALDVQDAVFVVQDWGGPVGLRWAISNAERVAGLVILNTGLFTGRVSQGFLAWRDFAERNPDLPVGFVVQSGTATELPDDIVAAYEAPFPSAESKAGAAAFPLLVPTSDADPGAADMRAVADALSSWSKPCLVAFSDSDPVFPYPKSGDRFTALVPSAGEQVRVAGAAHFLQEDAGEELGAIVVDWLDRAVAPA